MKINLGLQKPILEKEFVFDANEEYEELIIGKQERGSSGTFKIPSVVGLTEKSAVQKMKNVGVDTVIRYIKEGTGTSGDVLRQSVSAGVEASGVREVILTVLKK